MRFVESMVGTWQRRDSTQGPFRFDIEVQTPEPIGLLRTIVGKVEGTVEAAGLASATRVSGTIEISPMVERRIRYTFEFPGDDGSAYRFDGWKSISWLHALHSWTTLPGTIYDSEGAVVGTADTHFPFQTAGHFLASMLCPASAGRLRGRQGYEARRWDGRPGRLEVWYDTFTDPTSGTGFWLHHEIVAPSTGDKAEAHGWISIFPPEETPLLNRFGPAPVSDGALFSCEDVVVEPGRCSGRAGHVSWDLTHSFESRPLFTTSRLAWKHNLLPSAQIVSSPTEQFRGTVTTGDRTWTLEGAPGGAARIYGHGNAERWGWLHADLGGGDVLEVVAAVSHKSGLRRLRPLALVQLRVEGEDWPPNPLLAAMSFHASLGLPDWTMMGRWGGRILWLRVHQDAEASVRVAYRDTDGSSATCVNSERSDAHIVLLRRSAGSWAMERNWRLASTAHSEIGTRP